MFSSGKRLFTTRIKDKYIVEYVTTYALSYFKEKRYIIIVIIIIEFFFCRLCVIYL